MTTLTTDLELEISFNGKTDAIFIDVDYTIDDLDADDRDYCPTASRVDIEQARYGNEEINFLLSPIHLSEIKKQILENIGAMKNHRMLACKSSKTREIEDIPGFEGTRKALANIRI